MVDRNQSSPSRADGLCWEDAATSSTVGPRRHRGRRAAVPQDGDRRRDVRSDRLRPTTSTRRYGGTAWPPRQDVYEVQRVAVVERQRARSAAGRFGRVAMRARTGRGALDVPATPVRPDSALWRAGPRALSIDDRGGGQLLMDYELVAYVLDGAGTLITFTAPWIPGRSTGVQPFSLSWASTRVQGGQLTTGRVLCDEVAAKLSTSLLPQ